MESSFLNMAHYHGRKADNHSKHRRFDEAIKHHEKAFVNLTGATEYTSSSKIEECLLLQRDHHKRQIELLRLKKNHYEKYKKALDYSKKDLTETNELKKNYKSTLDLELAVYKNVEKIDSLLEIIEAGDTNNWDISTGAMKETEVYEKTRDATWAASELRRLNRELHVLIHHFSSTLDDSRQEIEELRNKLRTLENIGTKNNVHHDESRTSVSPSIDECFEYPNTCEKSEDSYETKEIPQLAPLELPKFDFDSFDCKGPET